MDCNVGFCVCQEVCNYGILIHTEIEIVFLGWTGTGACPYKEEWSPHPGPLPQGEREMRHEMARLRIQRHWIPDQVGDDALPHPGPLPWGEGGGEVIGRVC